MKRPLLVFVFLIVLVSGVAVYWGSAFHFSAVLPWSGKQLFWPLVVTAALVDSINPCAISVLLLTIAFLVSLGRCRVSLLKTGWCYISGIFLTYLLIGLGILRAFHLFGVPHFMAKAGAILLIVLGSVNLLGELLPTRRFKFGLPRAAHQKIAKLIERDSYPAAFVLGCLVGLSEFPCTGGPYLAVLGLLHDSQTYWLGWRYLLLYNLIFVLPLMVILFIASNKTVLAEVERWRKLRLKSMRFLGNIVMVLLGIFLFLL